MQWTIIAFVFNFALVALLAVLIRHKLGQSRMAPGPAQIGPFAADNLPASFARSLRGEAVQFCEKIRGWDLQHKPLHINQRGLVNRVVVTDQRVIYAQDRGRHLRVEFDFALAGVDRLNLQPIDDDRQDPEAVFVEVQAGDVRHYMIARQDFARRLAEAATAAKQEMIAAVMSPQQEEPG